MAKVTSKKIKIPRSRALGTCKPTMSDWKWHTTEKSRRASRSQTVGKGKLKFIKAPAEGWTGGMPETNGYRRGSK